MGEHRLVQFFVQINVQCSLSEFFVTTSLFKFYYDYVQQICEFFDDSHVSRTDGFDVFQVFEIYGYFSSLSAKFAFQSRQRCFVIKPQQNVLEVLRSFFASLDNLYSGMARAWWMHAMNAAFHPSYALKSPSKTGIETRFYLFHMSVPVSLFRAVLWFQHLPISRQLSVLCTFGLGPEGFFHAQAFPLET